MGAALGAHSATVNKIFAVMSVKLTLLTVDCRWAMTSTVRLATTLSIASDTRRSDSASSAEVASSKIKTGGFFRMARAIATRYRWGDSKWATFSGSSVRLCSSVLSFIGKRLCALISVLEIVSLQAHVHG